MKDHLLPFISDSQKRTTSPKTQSRRLQRQYYALPALLRSLILLIATVVAFATAARLFQNQRDIALKGTPSDFSDLAKAYPGAFAYGSRHNPSGTRMEPTLTTATSSCGTLAEASKARLRSMSMSIVETSLSSRRI